MADWNKLETEAEREGRAWSVLISAARILCRLLLRYGRPRGAWKCTRHVRRYRSIRCLIVVEVTEWGADTNNYADAGELWVYEGARTTPVGLFIADLAGELAGERVERAVVTAIESRSSWTRSRRQSCAGRWSGEVQGSS